MTYSHILLKSRSIFKIIRFSFLSLLITFSTLITHVEARSNIDKLPFYWEFMNVEIDLLANGDMLVTETQKYVFNRKHSNQRSRYIPLDKVEDITDVEVSENDRVIPSQVDRQNNQLWIKWQHLLNPPEAHTFVIKYRVIGGLQINSNTALVYWKAIFSDRKSPIQNAKVTVKLPESLAGKIQSFDYYPNSLKATAKKIDEQIIEFTAQNSLRSGQEFEVKVSFPKNILNLSQPKWQIEKDTIQVKRRGNSILFVILILFLIFLWLRDLARDRRSRRRTNSNDYNNNSDSDYGGDGIFDYGGDGECGGGEGDGDCGGGEGDGDCGGGEGDGD